MAITVKTGWLHNKNGDKFAPKTLTSQVQTSDGVLLEDKIQTDLDAAKAEILASVTIPVDSELSSTSTNPVQNKIINAEFESVSTAMNALETSIDSKANFEHTHTITDVSNLQTALDDKSNISHTHTIDNITDLTATATELNYMDGVTSNVQTQLEGKASSSHTHNNLYYTESEIDAKIENINTSIDEKADTSHTHSIIDIEEVEYVVNKTVHGQCVSTGTSTISLGSVDLSDIYGDIIVTIGETEYEGTFSFVTEYDDNFKMKNYYEITAGGYTIKQYEDESSVTISPVVASGTTIKIETDESTITIPEKYLPDSIAHQVDLDEHIADTTVHITSTERTNWNEAKTHADSAHAPSDAEKNQNAFNTIQIGINTNSDADADLTSIYPTIVADSSTDTIAFTGENVNINEVLGADTKAIKFSVNNASTDVAGVVQLVDSYKNESTTLAPTAKALRSAYKYLNDVYGQVSSYQVTLKSQIDTKANILTTINGYPLSDNITLTASDVDAYSKSEIDAYEFITTDDIDEICNASIVNAAELTF